MTTSGTAAFNLSVLDIIEEAFERCGAESRSGYDVRTARRSLNLLTIEWANRGINLWTITQGAIPLYTGISNYALPVDTIDLLDQVVRTGSGQSQTDININRISSSTYATIPNKNATGRPIQVWVDRQSDAIYPTTGQSTPQINVWPMPDQGSVTSPYYTFVYWRLRRIQDSATGVDTQDIPFRFLNALVAGLAYYMAFKLPTVDPQRAMGLKAEYDAQLQLAMEEDRDKASDRFVPRIMGYGR